MALPLRSRTQILYRTLSHFRFKSTVPSFLEIDIEFGSESQEGIRKIEDLLRNDFVQKSAPDWIHFVPGSSYWVPSTGRATSVAAAKIFRVVSERLRRVEEEDEEEEKEEEDEIMGEKTSRGWPSKSYFLQGDSEKEMVKAAPQSDEEE